MEGNDNNAPAGTHGVVKHFVQRFLEMIEFAVNGNSQSLNDARRRVLTATRFTRHCVRANGLQLFGCFNGLLATVLMNGFSDLLCELFVSVSMEDIGEFRD